jgi:GNAT superfamily N-acetyltransferase/predicted DCC family thiol-disulfide oxidoreductase YuxK
MLLYDGDCRFCATSASWLHRHARGSAEVRPWQQADLLGLGVSAEDCAKAVQWIGNGQRAEGPGALAAYLESGTGAWRATGRVLSLPVAQSVAWPVYRWLAPHRPAGEAAAPIPTPVCRPGKGIRRRRPRDLGPCARLLRSVYVDGQYPVYWPDAPRAWLADEEVLDAWVAERRGELVGHVAITRVGGDPVSAMRWRESGRDPARLGGVSRLFVRPRARGEGIGSALLGVAVGEIRARGLAPVLEVVTASADAVRLYEDQGWQLVGMFDWGHRSDRLRILYYVAPPAR